MIGQVWKIIRLLGFRRAVRMKKRHEQGLVYVRGYAACCCWQMLMGCGFLDELLVRGKADAGEFAQQRGLDRQVINAVLEYLEGIGLLRRQGQEVCLAESGRDLLAEPRGLFELLRAYDGCFQNLGELLSGRKKYGRDVLRDVTYVGIGSGRLCEQLPYPVMRRMVLERKRKMVLDLGCGDLAFLAGLCRRDSQIRGHGIDHSPEMIQFNQKQLERENYGGRLTAQQADMFRLPPLSSQISLPPVDCITACDTFHEYLGRDENKLVELLRSLKERFPQVMFVVGEFCRQDPQWLRKHPTASLEHHLFHELSLQHIGSAAQWRDIFRRAGLSIIEEQIFDIIGHGYFTLQ